MQAEAVEYARTRDPALKARIVEAHQPHVRRLARRIQARHEPLADVVQVCNVGLLESLERYDPSKGAAFHTFAEVTMRGVVRHYYRSTWPTHVPRRMQELHGTVAAFRDQLAGELGREPTAADIAGKAGATVAEVEEALAVGVWPVSIIEDVDEPVDGRHDVDLGRIEAEALLDRLAEMPRRVLYLRIFAEQSQTEVAAALGVSQMAVSRAERAGLTRLRALAA